MLSEETWSWYVHRDDGGVRYLARPMTSSGSAGETVAARRDGTEDPKKIAYLPAWMFGEHPEAIYRPEPAKLEEQ